MFNSLLKDIYNKGIDNYFLEDYRFNGEIKEKTGEEQKDFTKEIENNAGLYSVKMLKCL